MKTIETLLGHIRQVPFSSPDLIWDSVFLEDQEMMVNWALTAKI